MNNSKTTSTAQYEGELRTLCTHTYSNNHIETDAPIDNQGLAQRFSPTDLVATALASCMLTIMGIKARDMQINIDGTRCAIYKHMADNPRRIKEIRVEINFPEEPYDQKTRTILENSALSCPVAKSIHPDILQDINFIWPTE